jgi:hypothetical protein
MGVHVDKLTDIPFYGWIALAVIIFSQSIFLFTDARKRTPHYWIWGIWGLTTTPVPFILYMIFVRKIFKRKE